MQPRTIAFLGAGNMTRALLFGLQAADYPMTCITVAAPTATRREALAAATGVATTEDNLVAARTAAVIILAVKPQQMAAVCQSLNRGDLSKKLILSVVTGITLKHYAQRLGAHHTIIRVMPNTPALIGYGMSGLYAPPSVSSADKAFAESLLRSVGEVCWLAKEQDINTVIAAAGSAPAYFFQWMHSMQQSAVAMGLEPQQARQLVQQAALGAAHLAIQQPELTLQALSDQVTAKGGTTEAALQIFQQQQFNATINAAMQAAVLRAEALQQSLD